MAHGWFADMLFKSPGIRLPDTGVYHFLKQRNGNSSRLHLRIDPDGSGLLLINANQVFHLNPSATMMTFLHLNDVSENESIRILKKRFVLGDENLQKDLISTRSMVDQIIEGESCPICDLDLNIDAPFSSTPSAPYRMDLAITYRCNNACSHCYNARSRSYPELTTDKWKLILDKLWSIGIPHVVFTGGEPTLREDLPTLIEFAESIGQITGLNTNGRKLSDEAFTMRLVESGLDHMQITFESSDPVIHDQMVCHEGSWSETLQGLKNALKFHKYVMTNTTMLTTNIQTIPDTLRFLGDLGVRTVGLNALIYAGHGKLVGTGLSESQLLPLLETAKKLTQSYDQKLIWYTPTQYCNFDPVQNNLGIKGCTAALYNMCIEPNGDTIPCQSYYESLGNFLAKDWQSIWNHDVSKSLRERRYIQTKCTVCEILSECGGGCPLAVTS